MKRRLHYVEIDRKYVERLLGKAKVRLYFGDAERISARQLLAVLYFVEKWREISIIRLVRILKVTSTTLRLLIKSGKLKGRQLESGYWMVNLESLINYLGITPKDLPPNLRGEVEIKGNRYVITSVSVSSEGVSYFGGEIEELENEEAQKLEKVLGKSPSYSVEVKIKNKLV